MKNGKQRANRILRKTMAYTAALIAAAFLMLCCTGAAGESLIGLLREGVKARLESGYVGETVTGEDDVPGSEGIDIEEDLENTHSETDNKPILASASPYTPPFDMTAKAVMLFNLDDLSLVYAKNPHGKVFPASTTKIMTCILALENVENLDEEVEITANAFRDIVQGSSNAALVKGEIMTVRDLLYCLMVRSANEGANALAEYVGGSVSAFVDMMNLKAQELGMKNTYFTNPHGLHDPGHYTTAYDMALLALYAYSVPQFMEFANTDFIVLEKTNKTNEKRYYATTNYLLSTRIYDTYYYKWAKGMKTGSTSQAGYCLVSSADDDVNRYMCLVYGCDRENETNQVLSFTETRQLYEWAYNDFSLRRLVDEGIPYIDIDVALSKNTDRVALYPTGSIDALLPNKDFDENEIIKKPEFIQNIEAPIEKGKKLGTLTLMYGDRILGTVDLITRDAVERSEVLYWIDVLNEIVSNPLFKLAVGVTVALIALYVIISFIHNSRSRSRRRMRGGRSRF